MTLSEAIAHLPDDATLPVWWIREQMEDVPMAPKLVTTTQASELWSYSPEWWAQQAKEGHVQGAFQDGDGGIWRLPYASCEALIEAKQDARHPSNRRRREPWGPAPTQAAPSGPKDVPARKLEILEGGSSSVGRGPEGDAESGAPGLAGPGREDRARGDR